jgi:hypothetical protein
MEKLVVIQHVRQQVNKSWIPKRIFREEKRSAVTLKTWFYSRMHRKNFHDIAM